MAHLLLQDMNMNLIESLQDENQQAANGRLLGWYEEGQNPQHRQINMNPVLQHVHWSGICKKKQTKKSECNNNSIDNNTNTHKDNTNHIALKK